MSRTLLSWAQSASQLASFQDPDGVLKSWAPDLVDPCTWAYVTCNADNQVIRLDLGGYNLSGSLVPDLGKLEHLQFLELYENSIQGTIPPELGNLKSLISLDLYYNQISGSIPAELGKLQSLIFLRLNNNQLTGCVPKEISDLPNLRILNVSSNNLCPPSPTSGRFQHIPMEKFKNNPRMEDAPYDTNCDCKTFQS